MHKQTFFQVFQDEYLLLKYMRKTAEKRRVDSEFDKKFRDREATRKREWRRSAKRGKDTLSLQRLSILLELFPDPVWSLRNPNKHPAYRDKIIINIYVCSNVQIFIILKYTSDLEKFFSNITTPLTKYIISFLLLNQTNQQVRANSEFERKK